jgi:hypothetical protein
MVKQNFRMNSENFASPKYYPSKYSYYTVPDEPFCTIGTVAVAGSADAVGGLRLKWAMGAHGLSSELGSL